MHWLSELAREGALETNSVYWIDAYGLNADQAKINFWRHEHMPLPLKYLIDEKLLEDLKAALSRAESVGDERRGALRAALNVLAEELGGREKFGDLVRQQTYGLRSSICREKYWVILKKTQG